MATPRGHRFEMRDAGGGGGGGGRGRSGGLGADRARGRAGGRGAARAGAPAGAGLRSELSSIRFAAVARRLSQEARARGIPAPGFRSPPRLSGARRTIRREADGSVTISVALRGRPGLAVIGDLIDGVVVASGLEGGDAGSVHDELWAAMAAMLDDAPVADVVGLPARRAA